ncbi:MAG: hypothetical protein LIP02_04545 [Bacteroidales bacterium]|nr:hypothetical protein [Bacteroidales bacterium]
MNNDSARQGITTAIRGLWTNWAVAVGSLALLDLLSIWVSKQWLPFVAVSFALTLFSLIRINHDAKIPICHRVSYVSMLTLIWSALTMFVINIIIQHTPWAETLTHTPVNPRIPYITILIIAPFATLTSGWMLFRNINHHFCRDCIALHGSRAERGFLGMIFSQEGYHQMLVFFTISGVIAVAEWLYYWLFYINVNINSPDRFFYVWVPVIIYGGSLVFLGVRYMSLWAYYMRAVDGSPMARGSSTLVRFLIICGDEIFLTFPDSRLHDYLPEDEKIDTPARINLPFHQRVSDYEAQMCFKGLTDILPEQIRFLYSTKQHDVGPNIFHFAAIINTREDMEEARCHGRWISLGMLQHYTREGLVAPLLTSEIDRLYRITMAWKSYDRNGYRLYDIKHYHPTFRLSDFPKWSDLDYNDPNWLLVAANNEDRPFFRLRRLWRKHVKGLGE